MALERARRVGEVHPLDQRALWKHPHPNPPPQVRQRERTSVATTARSNLIMLYDRGSVVTCREMISFCGGVAIRVQSLPEQKKRPSAQASTRSVFVPFIVIIA
jgi:hypothetical protein